MRLAELVQVSRRIAETPSRLQKIAVLEQCLAQLSAVEAKPVTAWLAGVLPQGRLGVGPAQLRRCLAARPAAEATLTVGEVDRALAAVAEATGPGRLARREGLLVPLFGRSTRAEQEYLAQLLLGEVRQGALEALLVEALARTHGCPLAPVRRAVMLAGGLTPVVEALWAEGPAGLVRFSLRVMTPVHPMLAQTAEDVDTALNDLGRAGLEFKLDGARVQVHRAGSEVRVYTRALNDVTDGVPELVERVRGLPVREVMLDGETLALRPDGAPQPFQVTMRRFGRRLEVERLRAELPLSPFFFDVLFLDGEPLIDRPLAERWDALDRVVPPPLRVPRTLPAGPPDARAFLERALAAGHEGVMAKDPAAAYTAGSRGSAWLKVKRAVTLDLVVLAAEWGSGRREGWLSNLHLGARDPQGGFVMLGKTFKGLTDELLAWQTERLLALAVTRDGPVMHVRPQLVVEIAFNDVQASPHYPGGLALRFARVRRYRPDKRPEEADTIDTVRALYEFQRHPERNGRGR
jgi:DNA ligase-1